MTSHSVTADLRRLDAAEIGTHLRALDEVGFAIVPQLLPKDLVGTFRQRIIDLFNETAKKRPENQADNYGTTADNSKHDLSVWNLQYHDKRFIDLVASAQVQALIQPQLNDPFFTQIPATDPNYILTYLNARSSVLKLPLHTDTYIPVEGRRTWGLQTVFALDDQTPENGCTVVVPGSHTFGKYIDVDFNTATPLSYNAGDLLVFSSRLWHGALPNPSLKSRWSILGSFRMWWVKQSTDIPRGLPDQIYQQLSDSQKALLGFCSIPPRSEEDRISIKTGYQSLKAHVEDYWR